jgi:hypothetical protein
MAVMAREAWTDERLDDLNAKVDKGFDGVKGEIKDLRGEMNTRFNSIDARFDALQRTMVLGVVSMSATVVGALLVIQL